MSESKASVIFVEDDDDLRGGAVQALRLEGFEVAGYRDAHSALAAIEADFDGVVVTDVRLPGMDGIELFARLRELDGDMQVIVTTGHGDVEMAVDAMKQGAADFFTKPYALSEIVHSIGQAAQKRSLVIENRKLRAELGERRQPGLIGHSPVSQRLNDIVGEVAKTDIDLLLVGPSGAGKSYMANHIHGQSDRRDRPIITIDAGLFVNQEAELLLYGRDPSVALSRSGLIERAHGGTLVLEDIEQIPADAQLRLAGLVENRSFQAIGADRPRNVDVRVIATSNSQVASAGGAGQGDSALASRLAGITVTLPPLKERADDVPDFFRHFVMGFERELDRVAGELGEAEWHWLLTHDWPGNLRELRKYAQNFVLGLTRLAQPGDPDDEQSGLRDLVAGFEKAVIEDALRRENGRIAPVLRHLKVPRKTLYDKLTRHGLKPGDYRQ